MKIEVKVPQLPESVAEATLVSWHKKAGQPVRRDENLIDIETDKVVLELPAPGDGVLVDLGSTTTDIVPFAGGRIRAVGTSDAEPSLPSRSSHSQHDPQSDSEPAGAT